MSQTLRMGLRFRRGQKRQLASVIAQLEAFRPEGIDIGIFHKALDSIDQDEPLLVICDSVEEVQAMADGFPIWGLARPTVEGPLA